MVVAASSLWAPAADTLDQGYPGSSWARPVLLEVVRASLWSGLGEHTLDRGYPGSSLELWAVVAAF